MSGMGTSKSTQTQTSSTSGYGPAMGSVNDILGNIQGLLPSAGLSAKASGALDRIENNANGPLQGDITSTIRGLLSGGGAQANDAAIGQNLADYRAALQPTASGANIGNNTALKGQLDTLLSDVTGNVNSSWAAAGRDGSPGNMQALSRGYTQAAAPIVAAQYNTDVQRMLDANAALYGAGNNTYGILNQNNAAANTNRLAGVSNADATNWGANSILGAEQNRFAIPAGNYTGLLGAVSPIAAQFGTTTGTTNGTQTLSPIAQIALAAGALKNIWPSGGIQFGAKG